MAINDPRDIPGLRVWYSAEAETGYADGAIISTLTDLSGNGYHAPAYTVYASPQWMATGGPSGGAYIRTLGTPTPAGSGFNVPPAAVAGLTAGTAAIYLDPVDSGDGSHWDFGSSTSSSHYPFGTSLFDEFGTTVRKTCGALPSRGWHRYRASSGAGPWTNWADGSQLYTTGGSTVGWATTPRIAFSRPGSTNYTLNGFTTFVLYDHILTTTEAADLEAWMAAHPSGGTISGGSVTGTLAGTLPPLSGSMSGAYGPSGTVSAVLPGLAAGLAGSVTAAPVTGSVAAVLPPLVADLAGEAYPPGVAGDLAAVLPPLAADLAGTSTPPSYAGTLDAVLPALRANLAGQSFGTGTEGYIEALLPALAAALAGDALGRVGLGLVLDSTATLTVADVLEPEPSVPAGTPPTVLHIIAPTVPVPTLVAGRPQ